MIKAANFQIVPCGTLAAADVLFKNTLGVHLENLDPETVSTETLTVFPRDLHLHQQWDLLWQWDQLFWQWNLSVLDKMQVLG